MARLLRRLTTVHRDQEGFALVTALVLLAVMSLLMLVTLSASESANRLSERGSRWTRTLGVAEAGINDAIVHLSSSLTTTVTSTGCAYDGSSTTGCAVPGGEYQVTWSRGKRGKLTIESYGFYPTAASYLAGERNSIARRIRVTLSPPTMFKYALFSATTIDIKNGSTVVGDVFANEKVTLGNDSTVCGNVINATLGVSMGNGSHVVESLEGYDCDNTASVTSGGSITLSNGAEIDGDATASAPTETDCPPVPDAYYISGGTVHGTATACGSVSTSTTSASPNTKTSPPTTQSMPPYTFDSGNYTDLTCFPSGATCSESTTSATAVSTFNSSVSKTGMAGTYAIWQTQPTQSTKVSLEGLSLSGDTTIVTNAPIDLGNTGEVTTSADGSLLVIISTYIPPTGTTCSDKGGECSIYGKNSVVFDSGDPTDPDDGVYALLYTPGKMAFKNQANEGEGALWAGSLDMKNGFDIIYNANVERVTGFGGSIEQTLWEELAAG
jgi:hypothetical protein